MCMLFVGKLHMCDYIVEADGASCYTFLLICNVW